MTVACSHVSFRHRCLTQKLSATTVYTSAQLEDPGSEDRSPTGDAWRRAALINLRDNYSARLSNLRLHTDSAAVWVRDTCVTSSLQCTQFHILAMSAAQRLC